MIGLTIFSGKYDSLDFRSLMLFDLFMSYLAFLSFSYFGPSFRCVKLLVYQTYTNAYDGHLETEDNQGSYYLFPSTPFVFLTQLVTSIDSFARIFFLFPNIYSHHNVRISI